MCRFVFYYRFSRSNLEIQQSISFPCVRFKAVLPLQLLLRFKFRNRPFNFVLSQDTCLKHSVQFSVSTFFFVSHTPQEQVECCFDELLNWMIILLNRMTQHHIWLIIKRNRMTLFSSIRFRVKYISLMVKLAAHFPKLTEKTYNLLSCPTCSGVHILAGKDIMVELKYFEVSMVRSVLIGQHFVY